MTQQKKPGLGAIFLTVFLDLVGFGIVMPFLALQAREIYHVSEGVATLLGASYSLAQFLFVPMWGRLSDRLGRRPVLLISVFFSACTMAFLGLSLAYSDNVVWLFLARIFGGIATANLGTAAAYIADVTSKEDRVKGMGLIGMAFGLGFIIGPGVGGYLASFPIGGRNGPLACFAAAGLSLINFLWVWRGVPESLPPEKRNLEPRSLIPLNPSQIEALLRSSFVAQAVFVNFLITLAFSGLEMTFAFYAQDKFGLNFAEVGGLFVLMGVVAALVQGGFMRRAGRRHHDGKLITVGLVIQMLSFIGIVLASQIGVHSLMIACAALAIGNGLTQPSLSGFVSRRSSDLEQGKMLSTHHSFAALARVFGPALGGLLYQIMGAHSPFVLGAAINGFGLFLALRLTKSPMPSEVMA